MLAGGLSGLRDKLLRLLAWTSPPNLLKLTEVPDYLRFNPFVLTGYRPVADTVSCLRSLLYVHNETANIYSHGEMKLPNCGCLKQMTCSHSAGRLHRLSTSAFRLAHASGCAGMVQGCSRPNHAVTLGRFCGLPHLHVPQPRQEHL